MGLAISKTTLLQEMLKCQPIWLEDVEYTGATETTIHCYKDIPFSYGCYYHVSGTLAHAAGAGNSYAKIYRNGVLQNTYTANGGGATIEKHVAVGLTGTNETWKIVMDNDNVNDTGRIDVKVWVTFT
jgi:hypothetical protein